MSVRVLYDNDERKAVLYDSTTDVAFGPLFDDCEDGCCMASLIADEFLLWLRTSFAKDARELSSEAVDQFAATYLEHRHCPVEASE